MPNPASPTRIPRHEIESRAAEILRLHGLNTIPVDPVTLAHKKGIKVHNAKFSEEGLSGMVSKRGENLVILVNASDPPFRKRFTIAHELGHILLHLDSDGEFVDRDIDLFREPPDPSASLSPDKQAEVEANQFAAALLMPAELVRSEFSSTPRLPDLARKFNVSEEAMGIRLTRLGLIT